MCDILRALNTLIIYVRTSLTCRLHVAKAQDAAQLFHNGHLEHHHRPLSRQRRDIASEEAPQSLLLHGARGAVEQPAVPALCVTHNAGLHCVSGLRNGLGDERGHKGAAQVQGRVDLSANSMGAGQG